MKYALISDIHANLPALEAVLEDIDRRQEVAATYHDRHRLQALRLQV